MAAPCDRNARGSGARATASNRADYAGVDFGTGDRVVDHTRHCARNPLLGGERYGLWITITSLIAMVGFLDLGIGNALIGAIAEAQARNDREQAQGCVSAASLVLSVIGAILLGLFALGYPWLPSQSC